MTLRFLLLMIAVALCGCRTASDRFPESGAGADGGADGADGGAAASGSGGTGGETGQADCSEGESLDADGTCTDTDACAEHPCGAHAICTDLPAPALDDEDGRVCSCPLGHEGDGYAGCSPFVHPGLLHTKEDFERMRDKVAEGEEPWQSAWERLLARGRTNTDYQARPVTTIIRPGSEYSVAIIDAEWAYARALAWKITGDEMYADASIAILNAWSAKLEGISGNADRFLAAGILGHMFANIGEIMRTYDGWAQEDFERYKSMLVEIFYPTNHLFLTDHNGTEESCISNYWANWDLYNLASVVSIGVFADREDIYQEGVDYLYQGRGNGNLWNAVWFVHPGFLGQWQESGRDQGHSTGGISTLGQIAQVLYNQGHDLFAEDNFRLLAAAEFVARSNLLQNPEAPVLEQVWYEVPWMTYGKGVGQGCGWETHTAVSDAARGHLRPLWDLFYNHYVNRLGLSAPYVAMMAERMRPDGYGTDEFGYTTLTFSRDPISEESSPSGLRALPIASGVELSFWGSAYATSYTVKRSSTAGGPYVEIATLTADEDRTVVDADVQEGQAYYYVVSAETPTGELASEEVEAKVGVWPFLQLGFDTSSGAVDESGEHHAVALTDGVSLVSGRSETAASLDGIDGHLVLPEGFLSGVTDFTLSTWIQLRSDAANQWLLASGISSERYLMINVRAGDGNVRVASASVSWRSERGVTSTSGLPVGEWAHLAVTLKDGTVTIFINGVKVGEGAGVDQLRPHDLGSGTQNWIGRSVYSGDPYLDALIEDFRIYRGAMSAEEIAALAEL